MVNSKGLSPVLSTRSDCCRAPLGSRETWKADSTAVLSAVQVATTSVGCCNGVCCNWCDDERVLQLAPVTMRGVMRQAAP